MFTRPTTEQVLRGIARELHEIVAPTVNDERAKVLLGMIDQLLKGCAERAAHEIAWMYEEIAAIDAACAEDDDPAVRAAIDRLHEAQAASTSLHLEDVIERYQHASDALGFAVEAAYRNGDHPRALALRDLLLARNGHEMQVVGALDLVGRG